MCTGASFSSSRSYTFSLERAWEENGPMVAFPVHTQERHGLLGVAHLVVVHTEPKASGRKQNVEGDKPGKLGRCFGWFGLCSNPPSKCRGTWPRKRKEKLAFKPHNKLPCHCKREGQPGAWLLLSLVWVAVPHSSRDMRSYL